MSPAADERDRIRAATARLLAGTHQRSNGALTIVALATEAGVPRNALTQRHLDLKNEFYDKVRARGETPESERRLREQLAKTQELRAQSLEQVESLTFDNEALVSALHLTVMENRQLRLALAEQPSNVHALPAPTTSHRPPTTRRPEQSASRIS